jgi:hypothetical protein
MHLVGYTNSELKMHGESHIKMYISVNDLTFKNFVPINERPIYVSFQQHAGTELKTCLQLLV